MRFKTRSQSRRPARARRAVRSLLIEGLEDRRLLSFSPAAAYPVTSGAQDVATGDFNGDGRLDLAVVNASPNNSVSLLLGSAGGTFQAAVDSPTGAAPRSVVVGDLNNDGKLDLVTSNFADLSVLLGNGNGTFQAPRSVATEGAPAGVAVGDVNADGKLDLVAASSIYYPGGWGYYGSYPGWHSSRLNVLIGNGAGSFAPPVATPTGSSYGAVNTVALADFNGDGKLDAATADVGSYWDVGYVVVAYGNGSGGFGAIAAAGYALGAYAVTAGDVNGDGKADLVTTNPNTSSVGVLIGNGTGGFAAPANYPAGSSTGTTSIADFNGDGRIDLACANSNGGVSVLLNGGSGVFRPPLAFAAGAQPVAIAAGDFNGDGRPDVASANASSHDVSVLLNDANWPSADAPTISIAGSAVTEGDTGTTGVSLVVKLSAASANTVTVRYATADGNATAAGGDYVAASGIVSFAPGELSKTIGVQVKGDRTPETDEAFYVVLSEPTNAFVGASGTGGVTIHDDEPFVSIDDHAAAEGNSGAKSYSFTVRLSRAAGAPVTVDYSTVEGDTDFYPYNPYSYYYGPPAATAGSDFQGTTGTLTFAAGETAKTLVVVVNGDRTGEQDEAFSLNLSNPTGAAVTDNHGVGTIQNDDPFVGVAGGSVTEGNSGTKLLPFTLTLSNPSDLPVTVNYATADGTATTASGDYVAKSSSVTFAPGETTKTVNVTINGDRRAEGDESVVLNLGTVTNAGVYVGQAAGYIVDDEPRLSVNSVSVTEGNKGTKLMTFTVTLEAASDQAVTVNYATANGSATGGDYVAKSGTLTFAPGQTSRTFTVSIKGDKQREWDEEFYVRLSSASANASIVGEYGTGTILNDDGRSR